MGRRIQTGCLVLAVLACWSVDSARAQVGMLVADKPAPAAEKHAPAAEHQEKPHVLHEAEAHAEHEEEEHSAFIVRGAYLLMQPRRRAMDFAIVSGTTNGRPIGNLVEAPWESTSGLRAGLAYRLPSDGWEIGVEYTYLFTDSTRSVTAPP
ncbi:MAG: hypothetical protein JNM56_30775, partial [Planctomycetia bacterium]|nr:hypothetical protein [Planctomycetia bacterium]